MEAVSVNETQAKFLSTFNNTSYNMVKVGRDVRNISGLSSKNVYSSIIENKCSFARGALEDRYGDEINWRERCFNIKHQLTLTVECFSTK